MALFLACGGNPSAQNPGNSVDSVEKRASGPVGGGCDGCELMFEDMPEEISNVATMPDWASVPNPLIITGTVWSSTGQEPQEGVILYFWQTDEKGLYQPSVDQKGPGRRHGAHRAWAKTGPDGRYILKTIRPAPYPSLTMPAHIHISVKEPEIEDEYYTDDIVFADDPLVTPEYKEKAQNRAGNGIIQLTLDHDEGIWEGRRDFFLGKNIPNYPK